MANHKEVEDQGVPTGDLMVGPEGGMLEARDMVEAKDLVEARIGVLEARQGVI